MLLTPAWGESVSWIRDAEIEEGLERMVRRLFEVAKIDTGAVRIIIALSSDINASVLPGGTIIIHTGLLLNLTTPEQLLGVLAHETGHLRGGHHLRRWLSAERSTKTFAAGLLLGGLAALGGAPQLAMASMYGGMHVAERSFLSDSREKENSADQATVDMLTKLDLPATGLGDFMKTINEKSGAHLAREDQYRITHPFPADRIAFFEEASAKSPFLGRKLPEVTQQWFLRMQAKLGAFTAPLDSFDEHKVVNQEGGIVARYAQAIQSYRRADMPLALERIDALILEEPQNPYFHELKGQILFESGRVQDAVKNYQKAVTLHGHSPLLRSEFAHVLLESEPVSDPTQARHSQTLARAISELKQAQITAPDNPVTLQFLAVAYGRQGKMFQSILALVEKALSEDNIPMAREQAQRAQQLHARQKTSAQSIPEDERKAILKIQDISQSLDSQRSHHPSRLRMVN